MGPWIHGARVALTVERDWTRVLAEGRKKGKKGVEILLPLRGEDNSGYFVFQASTLRSPTDIGLSGGQVQPADLCGIHVDAKHKAAGSGKWPGALAQLAV